MKVFKIDVRGSNCPIPLVETRKAIRNMKTGDILEVIGTHVASKKEIPMAIKAMHLKIKSIEQSKDQWRIIIEI